MLQNEMITENTGQTGVVRPLIISDGETVRDFCSSLRHLMFGFEAVNITSAMVVPPGSGIESFFFPGAGIVEYPTLRFPLFYFQNRKLLISRIEEIKPTLIHCYGTAKALSAGRLAEHFGIPAIVTINSGRISTVSKMIINKYFQRILVPSGRIGEMLKQNGLEAEKISQVNIGTFTDDSCACFLRPERMTSIIVPGYLDKFSNYEPLLGALRHLSVDGYEFVVVIMGTGPAEKQIREFIKATGLIQTVTIAPQIRPVRAVFRGCDILIHPRCFDKFDSAVIEAAGAGVVVLADKNNIEEFLQDESTSVLFDSGDELSIYSSLQKILDNKELAKSIAMNSQNILRCNYTVSSMVGDLLKIYSETKINR
jgi:glycosyltransferase involved in cell wall biosynthesis